MQAYFQQAVGSGECVQHTLAGELFFVDVDDLGGMVLREEGFAGVVVDVVGLGRKGSGLLKFEDWRLRSSVLVYLGAQRFSFHMLLN